MDISELLADWPLGEQHVRWIVDANGNRAIQRRIPMGILQMNAEGRPDVEMPRG